VSIEDQIPSGWKFYSADFSCVDSKYTSGLAGTVMLIRDKESRQTWHTLSEAMKSSTPLYVQGNGMTFQEALNDACARARQQEAL
jgi:hypothetical protein